MTVLKRSRQQDGDVEALAMANSLMLLSRVGAAPGRVFACKTCNREFPSFQALGGHRASHKKPRLTAADGDFLHSQSTPEKPKAHECSICGLEFAIGQALGGHMRRHRPAATSDDGQAMGRPVVEKSENDEAYKYPLSLHSGEGDIATADNSADVLTKEFKHCLLGDGLLTRGSVVDQ
ncbi:hypothetical protein RHGRI_036421 [Rhododendron griersonianum]|uniref:C2H2-type domain-containing protein n=1 Tax=Rhododendron griersonianum TaxID=479676 RepID=A0AAV6HNX0_9ERIC|nr:hypothetical protein RHGRI_036421 [Rhododendron griersonianum]